MMIKQPSTGLVRVALSAGLACAASVAFAATAWSAIPPVEIAKPLPVATMAPRANPAPRSKPLAAPGLIAEPSAPAATVPVVSSADKGVAFAAPLPAAVAIELAAAAVEQGARHPVLLASNDRPAPTQPALVASTRAPKQDHIEHPEFLHAAKPRYPRSARGSLIPETGVVVLSIDLDERGNPLSAAVVSSDLGKDFEKAAMTAMLKSRFKPARKNGVAVTCTTLVPVYFERDLDIRHSNRYAVPGPTRSGAFQHQRIDITNRRPG